MRSSISAKTLEHYNAHAAEFWAGLPLERQPWLASVWRRA